MEQGSADKGVLVSGDGGGLVCLTRMHIPTDASNFVWHLSEDQKPQLLHSAAPHAIVQLDCKAPPRRCARADCLQVTTEDRELLLVSTTSGCTVMDLAELQPVPIGKKARDGRFGGCFVESPDPGLIQLCAARPGRRVWLAEWRLDPPEEPADPDEPDPAAQVRATLRVAAPEQPDWLCDQPAGQSSMTLGLLFPVQDCLVSVSDNSVVFIDPSTAEVLGWHCDSKPVLELSVVGTAVVLLHGVLIEG